MSDGTRKVTNISEIVGQEGNQIVMQEIFEFRQSGLGEGGKVLGAFRPTGSVPTFLENLKARGLTLDPGIFDPNRNPGGAA
jgi:pilus assembly protein CpaF